MKKPRVAALASVGVTSVPAEVVDEEVADPGGSIGGAGGDSVPVGAGGRNEAGDQAGVLSGRGTATSKRRIGVGMEAFAHNALAARGYSLADYPTPQSREMPSCLAGVVVNIGCVQERRPISHPQVSSRLCNSRAARRQAWPAPPWCVSQL
ncbi:hypothetical protein DFH27DRAFT_607951 [Peziza echinospora]|nr:hypothetical protein DFH27DRAFT_607951 [Peziza echinospora]